MIEPNTNPAQPPENDGSMQAAIAALQAKRAAQAQPQMPEEAAPPVSEPGDEVIPEEELAPELEQEEPVADSEEQPDEGEPLEAEAEQEEPQDYVIDGEVVSTDEVKEWRDGYMRQSDYTKKTKAVADKRQFLEHAEKSMQQMGQVLNYQVEQMNSAFKADLDRFANVDWVNLARENPTEYQAIKAEHEMASQRFKQFQDGLGAHMQKVQELAAEHNRNAAKRCAETLRVNMKGFGAEKYRDMCEYAIKEVGMDESVVLAATDPALFLLIDKAQAYDKARKVGMKKRTQPPKSLKTRRAAQVTSEQQSLRDLEARARKTGDQEDVLKLYRAQRKAKARK